MEEDDELYTTPGGQTDNSGVTTGGGLSKDAYTAAMKRQQYRGAGAGGAIATGLSGAAALAGQYYSEANKYNGQPVNAPSEQLDAYGRPLYNLGGMAAANTFTPHGASAGSILAAAGKGAATGAAIGSILPIGVSTLAGGIIGAVVGAGGEIISGIIGKNKGNKRKTLAAANLQSAQQRYSKDTLGFNNRQIGISEYQRMNNNYNRLQNLWQVQSGEQPNG